MKDRNRHIGRRYVTKAARAPGGTRHLRAALTAALCTALPLSAGAAQSAQQPSKDVVAARVDSMVQAYMAEKAPASMSVAISRGSETLYERACGLADVAANRPATTASIYKIGSVSKQFTAVLLLRQVERGNLALTDSIGGHLTTGLRPEWRSLTIEQLLNHTSGLQNDFEREGPPGDPVSADTMIAWAARDTMIAAPGTRFAYSNVGYLLLGVLVEKLYGKPYGAALREEITVPLGLRTLGWCTEPNDATGTMGSAYDGPGQLRPQVYIHPDRSLGAGGLCATAADLAAWNRALHGERVLSPASYAAMTTPRGAAPRYGFGLQLSVRPAPWGARILYHLGATAGFAAENAWLPAESLSVTILSNSFGPENGFPSNFILEVARAVSAQAPPPSGAAAAAEVVQPPPVSGAPPSAAALTALVDSVVTASLLTQGVPSVSVVVTRGGETLVQRAWGRADVASGRAADPSTLYEIGSTSKQFTAALVLRLVDRGRLTLGDSIGRHLSGLPPEWREITIEQLLNHTSGLQRSLLSLSRMAEDLPGDSLIAQAARDTMFARLGTTYSYSNGGYLLLAVLVEKLYGQPFGAVLRDEIARPLGLAALRWPCGDGEAGTMAAGYGRAFDGTLSPPPAFHPSQTLGAGGICSTAADLAKWNRALHGGRVLSGTSYRAMTTPRGAAIPVGYGLGLSVRPAPWGGPAITHGGQAVAGFVSENGWYPADSLSVSILYNAVPRVAAGGTHIIAALALGHTPPGAGNPAPEPVRPLTPATGIAGDEARRQFVGEYQLGNSVFKIDFEEGTFVLTMPGGEKNPMAHVSGATYRAGSDGSGPTITFLTDPEGRVGGFLVRDEGSPDRRLRKIR